MIKDSLLRCTQRCVVLVSLLLLAVVSFAVPAKPGLTRLFSDASRLNDKGQMINDKEAGAWFDLSGRKLDKMPTRKGLYINNGREVVIK